MYSLPGDAEVSTYIKVEKIDGTCRYYMIIGDQNIQIDEDTYYRGVA